MRLKVGGLILLFLVCIVMQIVIADPDPSGAQVTEYRSERGDSDTPNSHPAYAGNLSDVTITGDSITLAWQGYFGNVSGNIILEDANNNSMYRWGLASPQGEVYASNASSVIWANMQCFNFSALGESQAGSCTEAAGATSLCGKNLTEIETEFNITWDDTDGVNETFNHTWSAAKNGHAPFYVGSLTFSEGECMYNMMYGDTLEGVDEEFEEVLLWDPDGNNTVFASLLEDNMLGFDNTPKDFEMIVLENGHNGDTATTDYWFYIELE